MDRYEHVKDIGYGYIGVAKLMREKKTNELVAVKYIKRGETIDKNVERELVNHRLLRHPNIVRFKEVFLTPTHLAIAMEYAGGGELFKSICQAGRFTEKEASFYFQQLISGITYCHQMQICHRDLKLENLLVEDGSPTPRLKICDFGFSKSSVLHSEPNSIVGTPAYMAPEVLLSKKDYDGKIADVWCCGVTLYVMLVGSYPFEDPKDPTNFQKTIMRILKVHYSIPEYVHLSSECRHLLSKIFVANPAKRIRIVEIQKHPWFVKNLQRDKQNNATKEDHTNEEDEDETTQSVEEIMRIVKEGRGTDVSHSVGPFLDDEDDDEDSDIPESIDEFVCAI